VGSYQRALFPTGVVVLLSGRVCVDREAWGCDWVGCMHVAGLGFLRGFLRCELGLLFVDKW